MQSFPIDLDRFAGVKNASIKRPTVKNYLPLMSTYTTNSNKMIHQEIAYFSYDDNHVLHPFSDLSLRYYYPPIFNIPGGQDTRFPIDLSVQSPCPPPWNSNPLNAVFPGQKASSLFVCAMTHPMNILTVFSTPSWPPRKGTKSKPPPM